MSPLQKALPLILVLSGVLFGQATPVDCTPGTLTFTSAAAQSPTISNANTATPCRSWEISYDAPSTLTVLSLQFETSPDNSVWTAVPNNVCSSTQQPPCVIDGANPSTTTGNQTFSVAAYGRFVRINVTTFTGTGTLTVRIFGYKGLSARVRNSGSGGGGGGMTVAGTTNQIAVSGTCNDTAGTCTVKLPNASVTIDPTTGNFGTPGAYKSGVGGPDSGAIAFNGVTSGAVGFAAADIAGTAILYVLPSTNGVAGQILTDNGATTCPTLAAGLPGTCHQLIWGTSLSGSGVGATTTTPNTLFNAAATPIQFDTQSGAPDSWDTSGGTIHSTTVNKDRFVATSAGRWQVICAISWGAVSTPAQIYFDVNAAGGFFIQRTQDVATVNRLTTVGIFNLALNDFVRCNANNQSGADSTNYTAEFSMIKLVN